MWSAAKHAPITRCMLWLVLGGWCCKLLIIIGLVKCVSG
jgi:hypothetical protein